MKIKYEQPGNTLDLHYRLMGGADETLPMLVFLHGMFGSGGNMGGIARAFEKTHRVLLVDLRNHGRSPADDLMDYPCMVADLTALLDRLDVPRCSLIGHSMGGKVAMYFALTQSSRVQQLVCLDMAPVTYPARFGHIFEALLSVSLEQVTSRSQVIEQLEERLEDPRLRAFLAHSLESSETGWRWRFNLAALQANGELLRSFPELPSHRQYSGPALFLYGDQSDYMQPEYWPAIIRRFPQARSRAVIGAGHWLHADSREEVISVLQGIFGVA